MLVVVACMIEIRFWGVIAAHKRYISMVARGFVCNMSSDGRGVIVRFKL